MKGSFAKNIFNLTFGGKERVGVVEHRDQTDYDKNYQNVFDEKWPTLQKFLYNIYEDPQERNDLKESHPEILEILRKKIRKLYSSLVRPDSPAEDDKGNPIYFNGVWGPGWC